MQIRLRTINESLCRFYDYRLVLSIAACSILTAPRACLSQACFGGSKMCLRGDAAK